MQNDSNLRPTGITELDQMLHGGIPPGSCVLLAGKSGTGKTILALEWLFRGYEKFNEPGIYLSFTEPIYKSLFNSSKFRFFKKENTGPLKIFFSDMRSIMRGLDVEEKDISRNSIAKIIDTIRTMTQEGNAKRVVIDSITAIAYRLKEKDLIREFIFGLGTLLAQLDAIVIMTSEVLDENRVSVFGIEEFISDGIIKLYSEREYSHVVRKLEIVKMRSSTYNSYPATFNISCDGIQIYPHIARNLTYEISKNRVPTGVLGIDMMTREGYFEGSCVLLAGASGSGKTILSLQFINKGLELKEKCIYVSFEESRSQLYRNALAFGWDLEKYEKDGLLMIIPSYPEEKNLEEHINVIGKSVKAFKPKRLVMDSLSSLSSAFSDDILYGFTSRLIAFLKERSVTHILTTATSLMGMSSITESHLSTLTDVIQLLRYIEIESEFRRGILILKMRGSEHDKKLREMTFTKNGIRVLSEFKGYEGVFIGSARKVSSTIEEQLHRLMVDFLGPMGENIFITERKKGFTHESIENLINEFGSQGIISQRRKEEFLGEIHKIFGTSKSNEGKELKREPISMKDFLNIGK